MMHFDGSVTLITGASSGIGAACARQFSALGARVVVNYRVSQAEAEKVVAAIRLAGGQAWSCQADVTRSADVERMVAWVTREIGPVDVLVNNVGDPIRRTPLWACSEELWDRVIDLNLKSAFLCTRAVLASMMDRGRGAIVNVTAYSPRNGGAGLGTIHYAAAKAGVESMTLGLAKDLAPTGIRVNAVAPGLVDTPLHGRTEFDDRYGTAQDFVQRVQGLMPMKRAALADEIARTVVFLASSDSSYTTGQVAEVTGGM